MHLRHARLAPLALLLAGAAVGLSAHAAPSAPARLRVERRAPSVRALARRGADRLDAIDGVAYDASGRLVVAGSSLVRDATVPAVFVARFARDGRLDSSFGTAGVVSLPVTGRAGTVALDEVGRIVVTGTFGREGTEPGRVVVAARLLDDGALDPEYGDGGFAASYGYVAAVGRDGSLFCAAPIALNDGDVVWRMGPDGRLDPAFAGGALVPGGIVQDVAALADGGCLAYVEPYGVGGPPPGGADGIARFGPTGALDASFGTGGRLVGPGGEPFVGATRLDASGRILVLGQERYRFDDPLVVRRFLADGRPDPSFRGGGSAPAALVLPDGARLLGTAFCVAPDGERFVLAGGVAFGGVGVASPNGWVARVFDAAEEPGRSKQVRGAPTTREPRVAALAIAPDGSGVVLGGTLPAGTESDPRWRPLLVRLRLGARR